MKVFGKNLSALPDTFIYTNVQICAQVKDVQMQRTYFNFS